MEEIPWREPDRFLRWDFLPKLFSKIPVECVLADDMCRPAFLAFCFSLVSWTIERLSPPWLESNEHGRDHRSSELYQWRVSLFRFLAHVALLIDLPETEKYILDPMFKLNDELALSLVSPFVDLVICRGILDAEIISSTAVPLIKKCIERVLRCHDWNNARHREGDIYGFDLPSFSKSVLMVQVEQADLAARFANGDWSDIQAVMVVIDLFVRAVGDIPTVTYSFLKLCEKAHAHYPVEIFADQITTILARQSGTPVGWRNSTIPSRIAALTHTFAERSQPLSKSLGQTLLRILDRLVDMGDRRSAALQTSELFKTIKSET
jgi:hypothetical protein